MPPTQLTLVRHGESNWNRESRQQGHLDSGLSPRGVAQAEAVARRLAGDSFVALYSSDLGRALRTAEIIGSMTGHAVAVDERLRERNLGVFQGKTWEEIKIECLEELRLFRTAGPDYVIPGGESARQRYERTVGCLEKIARRHPGESLVVVAHGGVLDGLFRRTLGIPLGRPRRFRLCNASLNLFFYEDGEWTLGTWGDTAHLADIGALDDT